MSKTSATAEGLQVVSSLKNLEFVALNKDQLSSDVIASFKELPKIKIVRVFNSEFAGPLLAQLKEAMPIDVVEEF